MDEYTRSFLEGKKSVTPARVIDTFGGAVRLLDVSHELPGLRRRPGVTSWKVWHRGQWHEDYASVEERFPQKCPTKLASLFAPVAGDAMHAMHLERCVRIMPHDQDTGGFFVAVFEKVPAPLS